MHDEFDLTGGDGTRLVAWRNRNDTGPRVLICNGMAVPPQAWPRLLSEDSQFNVAGWNHRGCFGSDRPADPDAVRIEDHVADAVALLDHLGWDSAIVVGWSLGVNVAFELAKEHPERVSGMLGVAGVPGGTFDTLFAPQLVPRVLRRPLGTNVARLGRLISPGLNFISKNLPTGRPLGEMLRFSGVVLPHASQEHVADWAGNMFKDQDFDWYFHLALGLAEHEEFDPSFMKCPVTVVAGSVDFLTSGQDVIRAATKIPNVEVHTLPGTHCLPLEFPEEIEEMLTDLAARVEWQASLAAARAEAGITDEIVDDGDPIVDLNDEELIAVRDPDFVGT
ncbi:MAG: alpha/beta hydrolase [Actinobacteria bacterium]|nr:alpha/beta hydrolase [Actinomycetota bacterium]